MNEIINLLFSNKMVIVGRIEDLQELNDQEVEQIFEIMTQKIAENWQTSSERPRGMEGLFELVKQFTQLRGKFVDYISSVPIEKFGPWAANGWDDVIPTKCRERSKLDAFLNKLRQEGSEDLKMLMNF